MWSCVSVTVFGLRALVRLQVDDRHLAGVDPPHQVDAARHGHAVAQRDLDRLLGELEVLEVRRVLADVAHRWLSSPPPRASRAARGRRRARAGGAPRAHRPRSARSPRRRSARLCTSASASCSDLPKPSASSSGALKPYRMRSLNWYGHSKKYFMSENDSTTLATDAFGAGASRLRSA